MNIKELKPQYSIFGNKGAVWGNKCHIYKNGKGILCGIPGLSSNWARIEEVQEIGCPDCLEIYSKELELV